MDAEENQLYIRNMQYQRAVKVYDEKLLGKLKQSFKLLSAKQPNSKQKASQQSFQGLIATAV